MKRSCCTLGQLVQEMDTTLDEIRIEAVRQEMYERGYDDGILGNAYARKDWLRLNEDVDPLEEEMDFAYATGYSEGVLASAHRQ